MAAGRVESWCSLGWKRPSSSRSPTLTHHHQVTTKPCPYSFCSAGRHQRDHPGDDGPHRALPKRWLVQGCPDASAEEAPGPVQVPGVQQLRLLPGSRMRGGNVGRRGEWVEWVQDESHGQGDPTAACTQSCGSSPAAAVEQLFTRVSQVCWRNPPGALTRTWGNHSREV